jgi:hypothetical protein
MDLEGTVSQYFDIHKLFSIYVLFSLLASLKSQLTILRHSKGSNVPEVSNRQE